MLGFYVFLLQHIQATLFGIPGSALARYIHDPTEYVVGIGLLRCRILMGDLGDGPALRGHVGVDFQTLGGKLFNRWQ